MKYCLFLIWLLLPLITYSQTDPRICINQSNIRDRKVINDFKKLYPCPSTGKSTGNCPGYSVDHVIPLACSGCDSIINLQWLPNEIKSCNKPYCKDRFERRVYTNPYSTIHCRDK